VFRVYSVLSDKSKSLHLCMKITGDVEYRLVLKTMKMMKFKAFRYQNCALMRFFCYSSAEHPRNQTFEGELYLGETSIESYTLDLARDSSSVFAKNIHNFIACTRESREKVPQKVMSNMRQFMNGMKNYLVKHGEKDFAAVVEKARTALKPETFLNLDRVLEAVMHQLIVLPLRDHLYDLLVDHYAEKGDLELMVNTIKYGDNKDKAIFGIRVSF